jgi:7,8-dihydropterin-6-yl-methyl-4-(beta-D-ribofuranosyl)aminobenzene 5'-phosphate synthase
MIYRVRTGWVLRRLCISASVIACLAVPTGSARAGSDDTDVGDVTGKEAALAPDDSSTKAGIAVDSLVITVTYDNNAYVDELMPEWGFSCVVTGTEKTILFDTGGDGQILMSNIRKLGINPKDVDLVFLSHAHWDHTGGMEAFLEKNPDVTVFLPRSFEKGFKQQVGRLGAEVVEVNDPMEICRGVYSTGQLGTWIREQALILSTDRGLIVITGCAHPGIVEMIHKSKELLDGEVLLAMGGFHLVRSSAAQIEAVIAGFREAGVVYAAPCHCSGDEAREQFGLEYKQHYIDIGAGRVLTGDNLR